MTRLAFIGSALAIALLTACGVTPVPEPPNLSPPDASLITFETGTSVPGFTGEAGALEPGADLWVANLDSMEPPVVITPEADGSFDATGSVMAFPGQELRLQARMGDLRSDPVDISVGGGEIVRITADCLFLEPDLEAALVPGSTTSVRIDNACGAEARIEAIRLRAPEPLITVETAAPLVIGDGTSATLEISLDASASALTEEVVILDITAPETDRRAITVYGPVP